MESVLARFALEGRRIDSKSLHQPVGYFVGLHEPVSQMDYSGPLPDETIAVLYGLADQVIQQLLAAFREMVRRRVIYLRGRRNGRFAHHQ